MTVHEDELGLRWSGGSLAAIRARWADGDPAGDLCDQTRIPAADQPRALEALRHARADVHYLLGLIDAAGVEEACDGEECWDGCAHEPCGYWPVQDVPDPAGLLS